MNRPPARECAATERHHAARAAQIYRLYDSACDFPPRTAGPSTEFMLATLPRAGSTFLAVELWRTGVMGAPMEYANQPLHNAMCQRVGAVDDLIAYWNAVQRLRTSPNGVFGFKLFASDYINLSERHPELLARIAPQKIIFLTRANVVEQAVSYSKAIRSGRWFPDVPGDIGVAYDATHIQWCIATVQRQLDFWNQLFVLMEATPHHVVYEELVANTVAVIEGIAGFLGVQLDPDAVVALPHTQIQRNRESTEWVRRYNAEAGNEGMQR